MKKFVRISIAVICMVSLVVGYYNYLSRRNDSVKADDVVEISEVQSIINKDFLNDYPVTPRAVVKWYNRIISAYYSQDYTEEELTQMADQCRLLFDDELLAVNPRDRYLLALNADIDNYHERNRVIVSTEVSSTSEVEYKTVNGSECAFLSSYYFVREGSSYDRTYEDFCLRKDKDGKWKILTFKLSPKDDTNGF